MSKLFTEANGKRYKFITCEPRADYWTSQYRHLAPVDEAGKLPAWTTTLCGSTGTAEAFHGARTRILCGTCHKKFVELGGHLDLGHI